MKSWVVSTLRAQKETRSVYVNVQINFATSACTKRGRSFDNAHTANWCTQPPYVLSEINYQMGCLTTSPCNQTSDATVTQYNSRPCDNIVFKVAHCEQVTTILHERPNRHCFRYVHSVEAQPLTFEINLTKLKMQSCVSVLNRFSTRVAHWNQVHQLNGELVALSLGNAGVRF